MKARRANLKILYEGADISEDIAKYDLSFNYTDNACNKADDLQLSLEDRQRLWMGPWFPSKGAKISAEISVENWGGEGENKTLPCGLFEIDSVDLQGPPDTVNIKSVSVPITSSLRGDAKTKAWEKITLSGIAGDIAGKAGLALVFECDDVTYDRIDQSEQSDLSFLQKLATDAGICLKVTDQQLVLFDEQVYEAAGPVKTIKRTGGTVISYSFSSSANNVKYKACTVSYYNSEKDTTIEFTYTPSGASDGPVLKINERVSDVKEAERLAKKRLREKNKSEDKANINLFGDVELASGLTVNIEEWGVYDGKYIIEIAKHDISSSGYTTSLELRRVLEGY